jgi:hypothetical protein
MTYIAVMAEHERSAMPGFHAAPAKAGTHNPGCRS